MGKGKSPQGGSRKGKTVRQGAAAAGSAALLGAISSELALASAKRDASAAPALPTPDLPAELAAAQSQAPDNISDKQVLSGAGETGAEATPSAGAPADESPASTGDLLAAVSTGALTDVPLTQDSAANGVANDGGTALEDGPSGLSAAETAAAEGVGELPSADAAGFADRTPIQLAQAATTEAASSTGAASSGGSAAASGGAAEGAAGAGSASAEAGAAAAGAGSAGAAGAVVAGGTSMGAALAGGLLVAAGAGGGSGGGGGSSSAPATGGGGGTTAVAKAIRVVDPPIKNAKVVYDANHDGIKNDGEAEGVTDDDGNAIISYTAVPDGQFLVFGGTDKITGKVFDANSISMVMKDKPTESNGIISPITTLLAQGSGISEAELKSLMGLPAETNLSTYDFYAESAKGGAAAATANNVLQLATMIQTVSNATTRFLSSDATISKGELAVASQAVAAALKSALAIPKVDGQLNIDAVSNVVSKFSVAAAAQVRSGTTDPTATLDALSTAFTNGTLDTQLNTVLSSASGAAVGGGTKDDLLVFQKSLSNLAEATYKAFDGFDPSASTITSNIEALTRLSNSLESVADDLTDGDALSANSVSFTNLFQNAKTLEQVANTLSSNPLVLQWAPDELITQVATDSTVAGITQYGNSHVVGGALDKSYKGLVNAGVDLVNPTSTVDLYLHLYDPLTEFTGDSSATLNDADIQKFIDGGKAGTLPAFSDALNVFLVLPGSDLIQSDIRILVDILDGTIDGTYGGSLLGADLRSFGIDRIAYLSGEPAGSLDLGQMRALADSGLLVTDGWTIAPINDATLAAVDIVALDHWIHSNDLPLARFDLTDSQALALAGAGLSLESDNLVVVTTSQKVLGTSFLGLTTIGADLVTTANGVLPDLDLGPDGAALTQAQVQLLIDADTNFLSPATLRVSQAQLGNLLDMLDGDANGVYDAGKSGVDLYRLRFTTIDGGSDGTSGRLLVTPEQAAAITGKSLLLGPGVVIQSANNTAPTANNDTGSATETASGFNAPRGSDATGNVLLNDTDVNSDPLQVTAVRTGATEGAGTAGTLGTALTGTYGTLTLNATGAYTYVVNERDAAVQALAVGSTLTESFNYTMTDGSLTDSAVLTITINGANDAPVASDDEFRALETRGSMSGNVLSNDMDVDSATADFRVTAVRTGAIEGSGTEGTPGTAAFAGTWGTLTLGIDGNFFYQFDPLMPAVRGLAVGQTLTDSFNYTMTDGSQVDWAKLTFTIEGWNERPQGNNDTGSATESGGTLNATRGSDATGNVLANDTDVDSDPLQVTEVRTGAAEGAGTAGTVGSALAGTYGTLTLNASGTYTYVVNQNDPAVQALAVGATLTDSFNYLLADMPRYDSWLADFAVLTITINGANDAPVAVDDTASVASRLIGITGAPSARGNVLTNDTDVDSARAGFGVTAVRSGGLEGAGTAGSAMSAAGSTLTGTYGTLTLSDDGSYTYVVNENDPAVRALVVGALPLTESFNYTMSDGSLTDTAVLTIAINGANNSPMAHKDVVDVAAQGGSILTGNVLADDTDADNDPLVVAGVYRGPSGNEAGTLGSPLVGTYGTLTLNPNGAFSYEVSAGNAALQALPVGQHLNDTFSYSLSDGRQVLHPAAFINGEASITIQLQGTNTAPTAVNDTFSLPLNEGSATGNVLTNDTDAQTKASFAVTEVRTGDTEGAGTAGSLMSGTGSALIGTYGTLTLFRNGDYIYNVDRGNAAVLALEAGHTLTEPFNYTMTDGGLTDTAVLNITIAGSNHRHVANDDQVSVTTTQGYIAKDVTDNDSDLDDLDLNTIIVSTWRTGSVEGAGTEVQTGSSLAGTYGTLATHGGTIFYYTVDLTNLAVQGLAAGQTLTEWFNYTLSDGSLTDTAVIQITINKSNDALYLTTLVDAGGGAVQTNGITFAQLAPTSGAALASADVDKLIAAGTNNTLPKFDQNITLKATGAQLNNLVDVIDGSNDGSYDGTADGANLKAAGITSVTLVDTDPAAPVAFTTGQMQALMEAGLTLTPNGVQVSGSIEDATLSGATIDSLENWAQTNGISSLEVRLNVVQTSELLDSSVAVHFDALSSVTVVADPGEIVPDSFSLKGLADLGVDDVSAEIKGVSFSHANSFAPLNDTEVQSLVDAGTKGALPQFTSASVFVTQGQLGNLIDILDGKANGGTYDGVFAADGTTRNGVDLVGFGITKIGLLGGSGFLEVHADGLRALKAAGLSVDTHVMGVIDDPDLTPAEIVGFDTDWKAPDHIARLELHLTADQTAELVAADAVLNDTSGVFSDLSAQGTHLTTSLKSLSTLGVDDVHTAGPAFINLADGTELGSADAQSLIDSGTHAQGAAHQSLPLFDQSMTLRVSQAELDNLVDILDGTVDGQYDGTADGVNLTQYNINAIGFDAGGSSGPGRGVLNADTDALRALKDGGLSLATNEVQGSIKDATLTATDIDALDDWAQTHGINRLEVHLTAGQTTDLVAANAELTDASVVSADAPVDPSSQGTHVTTSLKSLNTLGVDDVHTAGTGFISLADGAALGDAAVQALIDSGTHQSGAAHQGLPHFDHSMTLQVSQAELANLVDILDGTVNGQYDGSHAGVDLTGYNINAVGFDATGSNGASALNVDAGALEALMEGGLTLATNEVQGLIDDATLTATEIDTLDNWAQSHNINRLEVHLTEVQTTELVADNAQLSDASVVTSDLAAQGSQVSTSLKSLNTLGVDNVHTDSAGFISLADGTALGNADVQALIAAGAHQPGAAHDGLPHFDHSMTLRVSQVELDNLVDILDGTVNGQYDGNHFGVDLTGYNINAIGFDPTGSSGTQVLNADASALQALMDGGLTLATNEVQGSINDTTLTPTEIDTLDNWAETHGINHLEVHLTADQTTALVADNAELSAASDVTADAPVYGSQVTTSLKSLTHLGVDHVNTPDIAFINLQENQYASLTPADVQGLLTAAANHALPGFNHDTTLLVGQADLANLVDLLDGTVDGHYDGTPDGIDFSAFGINHVGGRGDEYYLPVDLDTVRAVKDAGLDFANDPLDQVDALFDFLHVNYSAADMRDLIMWAAPAHGVDSVGAYVTDDQANALADLGALPDATGVLVDAQGSQLSTSFKDLATLGVDEVRLDGATSALHIELGTALDDSNVNDELAALLEHFKYADGTEKTDIFRKPDGSDPAVSLDLGSVVDVTAVNPTVLHELKLLGIDTIVGSDADHDGNPDHKQTT